MKSFATIWLLCFVVGTEQVDAATVDQTYKYARICRDVSCSSYGTINFAPQGVTSPVTVTDSSVTGYAWGDDMGWINFAPSGSGVAYNKTTGILDGYAWSESSGWITMRPSNSDTISAGIPVGVRILSDGSWQGWAFASGKNGGWIRFDCTVQATCVKLASQQTQSASSGGTYTIPQVALQTVATTKETEKNIVQINTTPKVTVSESDKRLVVPSSYIATGKSTHGVQKIATTTRSAVSASGTEISKATSSLIVLQKGDSSSVRPDNMNPVEGESFVKNFQKQESISFVTKVSRSVSSFFYFIVKLFGF